jgi:TonB-like protein
VSSYLGRPVQYLMHVKQVVRQQWVQALEGASPTGGPAERAEFVLAMDQTGRVTQVQPIAVSNQPAYDDPIKSALQRIISFGPPPPRVGHEVHVVFRGFTVTVTAASGELSTPTLPDR